MRTPFLEIKNLTKKFGLKKVIEDVNLNVNSGEILSLVGPSGSGKTTFLRCLAGLEQVSEGNIFLNGREITATKAENRPIVMMFQQPLLFPHMTVFENVVYGLKAEKTKRKDLEDIGEKMLCRIEMSNYALKYPYELSGGQQQRVALARALVMKPQVLLLDEPFASLDPELRNAIRTWVRKVLKSEQITAVFVTHDKEEAMIMGDKIAVMTEGKIQQAGSPFEVYTKPNNCSVAEVFSDGIVINDINFVPADKIMLRKDANLEQHHGYNCCSGKVKGKWLKSGKIMYQIEVLESGKELVLSSEQDFKNDEPIVLLYQEKHVHFMKK